MSAFTSFLKTLLLPALLALGIFLVISYAIVPLIQKWRRYRNRYTQYAPLAVPIGLSDPSHSSFVPRLGNLAHLFGHLVPDGLKDWIAAKVVVTHDLAGRRRRRVVDGSSPIADEENLADLVDEEEMESFDEERERQRGRREALSLSLQRGRRADESSERRLSRELEEGFRDDSDDSDDEDDDNDPRRIHDARLRLAQALNSHSAPQRISRLQH